MWLLTACRQWDGQPPVGRGCSVAASDPKRNYKSRDSLPQSWHSMA